MATETMIYRNYYKCCGWLWDDEWSCMCNDKCNECGKEVEPYKSECLMEPKPIPNSPVYVEFMKAALTGLLANQNTDPSSISHNITEAKHYADEAMRRLYA